MIVGQDEAIELVLTSHTPNSCGDVSVRKASALELHELNTTNIVNNMIPNNFFIVLSYMILSINFLTYSFKKVSGKGAMIKAT